MTDAEAYESRFGGIGRLYGAESLERLASGHVAVVGIGGVGSWAAEALARSGVGKITLIDLDDVCITNTNRQVPALGGAVGRPKVTVMAERMRRINPDCTIEAVQDFLTPTTSDALLTPGFDYLIDAIDNSRHKAHLIVACRERKIPIVTAGGAGGRWDPSQVMCDDLTEAFNDGLLRRVRKHLRREYGYPLSDDPWGIPAIYSRERPVFPTPDGGLCRHGAASASHKLDCAEGFGAASFVTGTYGFAAAAVAVKALANPVTPTRLPE